MRPGYPLDDAAAALLRALIVKQGVTTALGTAYVLTDSSLIGKSAPGGPQGFLIIYPGDPLKMEIAEFSSFNTATGAVTVTSAGGFSAVVAAGTPYLWLALGGAIGPLRTLLDRVVVFMDFWSDVEDSITIPAVAADLDFPSVVVANIPSGAVLTRVVALLKCRALRDSSAAQNQISAASKTLRVKLSTGAWGTDDVVAINFDNNQWRVEASAKEGGDAIVGDNELSSEVTGNGTYNFRSEETNRSDAIVATGASLVMHDVQVGLRIYFLLA